MHLCAEIVVYTMEKETSCTSPCIQFKKKCFSFKRQMNDTRNKKTTTYNQMKRQLQKKADNFKQINVII